VFPEHVGARFADKRLTLYLRRLKFHVLIALIKGSLNDYHLGYLAVKPALFKLYAIESTYCVIY